MSDLPQPHLPSHASQHPADAPLSGDAGRNPMHLFTLRLWHVELGNGHGEWRGRLHHVGHEDVAHFRGWAALLPLVFAMLRRAGVTISVEENG